MRGPARRAIEMEVLQTCLARPTVLNCEYAMNGYARTRAQRAQDDQTSTGRFTKPAPDGYRGGWVEARNLRLGERSAGELRNERVRVQAVMRQLLEDAPQGFCELIANFEAASTTPCAAK